MKSMILKYSGIFSTILHLYLLGTENGYIMKEIADMILVSFYAYL